MNTLCSLPAATALTLGLLIYSSSAAQADSAPLSSTPYVTTGCQTLEIVEEWLELMFYPRAGERAVVVPTGCRRVVTNRPLFLDNNATMMKYWGEGVHIYRLRVPTLSRQGYEDFFTFVPGSSDT